MVLSTKQLMREERHMAEEVTTPEAAEDRELATKPIPSLFTKYSLITLQGMVAQIIMVIVEGVIMGNGLGAHGLACVSIIMSVEYINLAFGNLFGTGVPTVVGNRLGAGDLKGAQHAFSQGFWMTTIVAFLVAVVFEIFTESLAIFFGATPDILVDTVAGIRTFGVLLTFTILGQMLTGILRVDEKPQASANIMTASAIIAAVWLALSTFIFGFGVQGAGIYYGLSIGIWAVAVYYFVGGKRSQLQIRLEDLTHPDFAVWAENAKIGFPFFLTQAGTFIYNTVSNNLLGVLGGEMGSLYIGAFAVINGYVVYIIMMVVESFAYGMQPIAAFNAGAKAWGRMKELVRTSLTIQIAAIAAITVVTCLAATPICSFFAGGDPELTPVAASATRIVILACALGYTAMMMSTYFQTVDKIPLATVLGLVRYVAFSVPLMYLMGNMMGVNGIWWALVVADVLTGVVCIGTAIWETKRLTALEQAA